MTLPANRRTALIQGPPGIQGATGPQGAQGLQGPQGLGGPDNIIRSVTVDSSASSILARQVLARDPASSVYKPAYAALVSLGSAALFNYNGATGADDTTAHQNALNSMCVTKQNGTAGGAVCGILRLPASGNINLVSRITSGLFYQGDPSHGITIEGEGDGSGSAGTVIWADNASFPANGTMLTLLGMSSSVLRNFALHGRSVAKYGIVLDAVETPSLIGSSTNRFESISLNFDAAIANGAGWLVGNSIGTQVSEGHWRDSSVIYGTQSTTTAGWRILGGGNIKNWLWEACTCWQAGYYLDLTASGPCVSIRGITEVLGTATFNHTHGGQLLVLGHNAEGDNQFLNGSIGQSQMSASVFASEWTGGANDSTRTPVNYPGALGLFGCYFNSRYSNVDGANKIVGDLSNTNGPGSIVSQRCCYYDNSYLPFYDGTVNPYDPLISDVSATTKMHVFSVGDYGGTGGAIKRFPATVGEPWMIPYMGIPHFNALSAGVSGTKYGHIVGYLSEPLDVSYTACAGVAGTLKDVLIYGSVTPKTRILSVTVDVTQGFALAGHVVSISVGKTAGAANEYAGTFVATTSGSHTFDVSIANGVDWAGGSLIYIEFTCDAGGQLGNMTAGACTVYIKSDNYRT